MQLFGRDHRKTVGQIKAHLMAEHAACSGSGAVGAVNAGFHNAGKQIEILLHSPTLADSRYMSSATASIAGITS